MHRTYTHYNGVGWQNKRATRIKVEPRRLRFNKIENWCPQDARQVLRRHLELGSTHEQLVQIRARIPRRCRQHSLLSHEDRVRHPAVREHKLAHSGRCTVTHKGGGCSPSAKRLWATVANKYSLEEAREGGGRLPPAGAPEGTAVAEHAPAVHANPLAPHLVDGGVDGHQPQLLDQHQGHGNTHQQGVRGRHKAQRYAAQGGKRKGVHKWLVKEDASGLYSGAT